MKSTTPRSGRQTQPMWWDAECEEVKRVKYDLLNKYRISNMESDLSRYKSARNKFRVVCNTKEAKMSARISDGELGTMDDVNTLWRKIKQFLRRGSSNSLVTPSECHAHFETLLESARYEIDSVFRDEIDT
jgi:hypothetical protein